MTHIKTYILHGSRKTVLMNLFIQGNKWRRRQREQTMDAGSGREGEGGMNGESNVEVYTTLGKIDNQ